jgi:predicted transcriptional regulator
LKSRSELVDITGIPRSTIYDAILRLMDWKMIKRIKEKRVLPGRPRIFYRIRYFYCEHCGKVKSSDCFDTKLLRLTHICQDGRHRKVIIELDEYQKLMELKNNGKKTTS